MSLLEDVFSLTKEEQIALLEELEKKASAPSPIALPKEVIDTFELPPEVDIEKELATIKEIVLAEVQAITINAPKGDKGDKGDKGAVGPQGPRGIDGVAGKDGKPGVDGKDGVDGISVTDARVDFDGSLVITLSDGKEINAGDVIPNDKKELVIQSLKNGALSLIELGIEDFLSSPTPIGDVTPNTGTFTSVITPSVTASSTDLTLSAISTGKINLNTATANQVQIIDSAVSAGQYTLLSRDNSLNEQRISGATATGGVNFGISSAVAGSVKFYTNGFTELQAQVARTASAVNYVQVTGGATTAAPTISAQGSDAAVDLTLNTKSTGTLRLQSNSTTRVSINSGGTVALGISASGGSGLQVIATGSQVNFATVLGSITGQIPTFSMANSSDTNVGLGIVTKGTGAIDLAAGSRGVNISNGGTVTAITRTAQGSGYTSVPSLAISAPTTAGGVQATATANLGVLSATIVSGGTGYTVGNTLTVVGGTGTAAQLTVSTVSSGVITAVTVAAQNGVYSVFPNSPVSVTGGSGSGATFNISGGILSTFTITNAGSGYIEQPTVTFSGGGGSGAAAYARVGSPVTVTALGTQINLNTENGTGFRVLTSGATATDMWQAISNGTTAILRSSNATANSQVQTAGTGALQFGTNNGVTQLQVSHTASAVNYVQVTGSVTGAVATISSQGSDAAVGLQLASKSASIVFTTRSGVQRSFNIADTASTANWLQVQGASTGNQPFLTSQGTDTNVALGMASKGNGDVNLYTNGGGQLQLKASHTASSVNYVQITGSITANRPSIQAQGSDAAVGLNYVTKSNGVHAFYTNGNNLQAAISHVLNPVNYIDLRGAIATGSPVISTAGSDTNIDLTLTPKGTGLVRFGTYTAGALTATGYISIKAADGTTYKVLVST